MALTDEEKPEKTLGALKTKRVEVVPYDPNWQARFEEVRQYLLGILSGQEVRVEHVGSTSVPGLAAKPILDIDIVLQNGADFEAVRSLLEANGYFHIGDLGITGREAFKYQDKPQLMRHNLYVLSADADELRRHLTFRDWLRSHPQDREAYAQVKIAAARQFPDDISAYIDAKSDVILDIYKRCGLFRPQDLPELARSVLINRYDLRVEEMCCKLIQPGIGLCQLQSTQGMFFLLVWEKANSASGESSLVQSAVEVGMELPLPTASGQQLCTAPFATFALFRSEQAALAFLSNDLWKNAANY
ncbi:MAG TPA: GrpB family protein [Anaerolineaceae bacterium]|nr:GrpB family protein [Anaerolineaceae bacterium]